MIFLFLYKSKTLILPKLPNALFYILGCTLLVAVMNSDLHNVPLLSYENTRRFIFWGLTILFFNVFCAQKEKAFIKIENAICLSSAAFSILSLFRYILNPEEQPYFTFGNINLSAEFIGFSLVFQLNALARSWKKYEKSIGLNLLTALSLTYIYFTNCRSVLIATYLIIVATFYLNKKLWKEFVKLLALSALMIFSVKIIFFIFYPDLVMVTPIEKQFSCRWLLYLNTVKMIIENPLGAGVGQYEFASIPYVGNLIPATRETVLFLSPHDEFLHFLAEDGVILSLLFFLSVCTFLYFYGKDVKKIFIEHPAFIYFSIVIFVQALFQFPLIEPLPYFITTIMVGYFFSIIRMDHTIYTLTNGIKAILFSLNFLAFMIFTIYFSSIYVSVNFPHSEKLNKLVCSFGDRNWLSCLNVASSRIADGDYDTAESYALRTLNWQPLNYQGIKMLGFSLLYQGNRRKACKTFKQYDSLFENQSSLHELFLKECGDIN